MSGLRKPLQLKFDENKRENWKEFKQYLNLYLAETGNKDAADSTKLDTLFYLAGKRAVKLYHMFGLEQTDTFETVMKCFESYCNPERIEVHERIKFYERCQQKNEPFLDFLTDIKALASTCNFDSQEDSMLRDKIVLGIQDNEVKEKLLRVRKLTVQQAVEICEAEDVTKNRVQNEWQEFKCKKKYEKCSRFIIGNGVRHRHYPVLEKTSCEDVNKVLVKCHYCFGNHWATECHLKCTNILTPTMPAKDKKADAALSNIDKSSRSKCITLRQHKGATKQSDTPTMQSSDAVKISNLSESTTVTDLEDLVKSFGPLQNVYLVNDKVTEHSKAFAYVHYKSDNDAATAIAMLNNYWYNKNILVANWARKVGDYAIRICNLRKATTIKELENLVRPFGPLLSITLAKDKETGLCNGSAHVHYKFRADAAKAIETLNNCSFNINILTVKWAKQP